MSYEDLVAALLAFARRIGVHDARFDAGGDLAQSLRPAHPFAAHAAYAAEAAAVARHGGRLLAGVAYRPTPPGFARLHLGGPDGDGHTAVQLRLANERLPRVSGWEAVDDAVRTGLLLAVRSAPEGLRARPWPMDCGLPLLRLSGVPLGAP